MLSLLRIVLAAAMANLKSRRELALENLALRQQLAVLARGTKRPKLTWVDRAFWVALRRWWTDWRRALMLVKPATVIAWHRKGFALYWTRKSRNAVGRPRVNTEIRALIRWMARDNIAWGAPRIHTTTPIVRMTRSERMRLTPEQSARRGKSEPSLRSHASVDFIIATKGGLHEILRTDSRHAAPT